MIKLNLQANNVNLNYLRYKTINSQRVPSEALVKFYNL